MDATVVTTTLIGAAVAVVGSFFAYLIKRRKEDRKDRELAKSESQEMMALLVSVIKENTEANQKVAAATERAADEAKARNGHLAEITMEARKQSEKLFDRNLKSYKKSQAEVLQKVCEHVQDIKNQHVDYQQVDKQVLTK